MGRQIGKKDEVKRKTKKFLTSKEEREIARDWHDYPSSYFQNKYGVSRSAIKSLAKSRNLKTRTFAYSCVNRRSLKSLIGVSGIYGIVTSDYRVYVGSSVDMGGRIRNHLSIINNKTHHNKSLLESYNNLAWFGIIEKCEESQLLIRESYYIKNLACIHNDRNLLNKSLDIVLNKESIDLIRSKVDITDNNCWEFDGKLSDGYGVIKKNHKRYFAHRIMYHYYNDDDHNKIIRHLCNNKKCCNPEHLKAGSVGENVRDRRKVDI